MTSLLRILPLIALLLTQAPLPAQEKPQLSLPDDPAKAWVEVEKMHATLRAPTDWRKQPPTPDQVVEFQKQVRQSARSFADKAREFLVRFPTNENVGDARISVVHALSHAVAAGDTEAEKQITAYVAQVLADKSIPEDNRVQVLLYSGNAVFFKKIGMRLFTEGLSKLRDEFELSMIESSRMVLKQFPSSPFIYTLLVAVAQRSKGELQKELATEIANAPGAPAGAKTLADHILKGTKPYQIGHPLDLKFTALDGREVDLAKLKGKVVMVEFWSTDCGPCIGQIPELKAVYEKLNPKGFEIIAISLDEKESSLKKLIKEKALPWPQYFDGKGWENQFATRYGIFSIPTTWLVDKRGNLRFTQTHSALEEQVAALLDESTSSSSK